MNSTTKITPKNSIFDINSPTIHDALVFLDGLVPDANKGLPQELFFFITRMTPMVNVDLLIKDENKRTLLAWRQDQFAGGGWHLPGGIVRYKERFEERVSKVAETELETQVEFDEVPLSTHQVICGHKTRGHFVSILYNCRLPSSFVPANKGLNPSDPGFIQWHDRCPDNLVRVHEMYRDHI